MLVTPRLYQLSQSTSDRELWSAISTPRKASSGWYDLPRATLAHVRKMLLVHQTGSLKVGEVARYTLTYTPSKDRVVPTPPHLCVRIRNTSAVPLRAAYLHGPYTLYVSCYPSSFDPHVKRAEDESHGIPQFEPNLKAGGAWTAQLKVPENIRDTFVTSQNKRRSMQSTGGSCTWIIEIASQVLFSTSATVHFEMLVGRDEKSVDFGFAGMDGAPDSVPGNLADFRDLKRARSDIKGVYSSAVMVLVEDTTKLWSKPELPDAEHERSIREKARQEQKSKEPESRNATDSSGPSDSGRTKEEKPKQKVHLVLITHGLHSNLGADMLYLKESIDATAKQAKLDGQMRRAKERAEKKAKNKQNETDEGEGVDKTEQSSEGYESDEHVIVRGFPGNAVRTERGIQYLGKRLAKYVLAMTFPDQPYLPVKKRSMSKSIQRKLTGKGSVPEPGQPAHQHSTVRREAVRTDTVNELSYKITSISFIGHSLGGLVQTYAVAYIQKHSPEFFNLIKPVNFVALATPFLGLSNENPLYVKFALDFGLVGRTGQDLGLTWRAPNVVRSGWGAMIAGIGSDNQKKHRQLDPGSKPLLRVLPAGPAHTALKLFRNRTVYSNVVNDGIVPLRTSCLLFLDWRGLGRVEKARRDNGIVGTMAGWGWAELTGMNTAELQQQQLSWRSFFERDRSPSDTGSNEEGENTPTRQGEGSTVPQPDANATQEDNEESGSPQAERFLHKRGKSQSEAASGNKQPSSPSQSQPTSPFGSFFNMLRPLSPSSSKPTTSQPTKPKHTRIYKRSQTLKVNDDGEFESVSDPVEERPKTGDRDQIKSKDQVIAPPKTNIFEAAHDLLNPPLPTKDFINDPESRPRTIFHDRVYHPDDIPPVPKRTRTFHRRSSSYDDRGSSRKSSRSFDSTSSDGYAVGVGPESGNASRTNTSSSTASVGADGEVGSMRVEEKIARAYHHELSWRKVLVRLEPDAHNNIVVRRMFANAYGWPVVKHLVDTHFSDDVAARTADDLEGGEDRAMPVDEPVTADGEEIIKHGEASEGDPKRKRRASESNKRAVWDGDKDQKPDDEGELTAEEEEELRDSVSALAQPPAKQHSLSPQVSKKSSKSSGDSGKAETPIIRRQDSAAWDDRFFMSDSDEDDDDDDYEDSHHLQRDLAFGSPRMRASGSRPGSSRDEGRLKVDTGSNTSKPLVVPVVTQSPQSTLDVGLKKGIDEQMGSRRS